jgi:hypothetical protein
MLDNVKTLLSHGCLLVADETGMTPEMYAVQKGFENIVDRLREYERGIRPIPHFLTKSYFLFSRKALSLSGLGPCKTENCLSKPASRAPRFYLMLIWCTS